MDSTLIAGVIGGICTVTAPILALLIKSRMDMRRKPRISAARQAVLRGIWNGVLQYDPAEDGAPPDHEVVLDVHSSDRSISGTARYTLNGTPTVVDISGYLVAESLIRVEYTNTSPEVIHFGTMLLQLSQDAKRLHGKLLAFGRVRGRVISGDLELEKQ